MSRVSWEYTTKLCDNFFLNKYISVFIYLFLLCNHSYYVTLLEEDNLALLLYTELLVMHISL